MGSPGAPMDREIVNIDNRHENAGKKNFAPFENSSVITFYTYDLAPVCAPLDPIFVAVSR